MQRENGERSNEDMQRDEPTCIIAEPVKIRLKNNKKGNRVLFKVLCNDIKWYDLEHLSKLKNLTSIVIKNRANRHGWTHKDLLAPYAPKGKRIDGTGNRRPFQKEGNAEWRALSDRPRNGVEAAR